MAHIFRQSLHEGVLPSDWKDANVTPIHKKGPKANPSNYRPVSLTSVCCKVMEAILKEAVVEHLTVNGLQGSTQYGVQFSVLPLLRFWPNCMKASGRGVRTSYSGRSAPTSRYPARSTSMFASSRPSVGTQWLGTGSSSLLLQMV